MSALIHPNQALFETQKPLPALASCEHYAGSEKLIKKSLDLQNQLGPIFDLTCDCEDGAQAGQELEQAQMIAEQLTSKDNKFNRVGVRIHHFKHPHWQQDVDVLVTGAAHNIAYLTLPKADSYSEIQQMVDYINQQTLKAGLGKNIPVHVLIETHGALKDVWQIAEIEQVEVLDFGLMDFVSAHHGAISAAAMQGDLQFEHQLIVRAKTEIAAAAAANGAIASHNVTLDLKNPMQAFADAQRAYQEFGYLRMWSVYPTQIEPIVEAMQPDYQEVKDAVEIIIKAQENHWGPIEYQKNLYDRASYRYYWSLLQRAYISGYKLDAAVVERFFS